MNISINNYEAYFLDYHEGNLSPALVKELMDFISQHPELREEFESFEAIELSETEGIKFDKKELLKKQSATINPSNFDEHAIQYVEGTLPGALQNELKTFISEYPIYQKELELYAKTKLVPDTSIVFEDKFLLKKGNKRPMAYYYWSAAASVAIIIVSYFILNKNSNPTPNGNNIVKHTQTKDSAIVANHISKTIDTNLIAPKVSPNIPANNRINNNRVALNVKHKKPETHNIVTPNILNNNHDEIIAEKGAKNIESLPVKMRPGIPSYSENTVNLSFENLQNIVPINNRPKEYNSANSSQREVVSTYIPREKTSNKILYTIAKYTCKGLHKVTGQRIRFEKRYDSDTTNLIAYQLDLGDKKIQFPLKEQQ